MPTRVIAYQSQINSTHSRVLVGARSGRVFFPNNSSREDLLGRAALAFNSALKAILWGQFA